MLMLSLIAGFSYEEYSNNLNFWEQENNKIWSVVFLRMLIKDLKKIALLYYYNGYSK